MSKRIDELTKRAVIGTWLDNLKRSDGWSELRKIIDKHISNYDKQSRTTTLDDAQRVKALEAKMAIEKLLLEIDRRIGYGKSAEKTIERESAV